LQPANPPKISDIGSGVPQVEAKAGPDARGELERRASRRRYNAETQTILEHNQDRRINRKLRTKYADQVFCYLTYYSGFVGIIVMFSGLKPWSLSLPEIVLSTLVGSTAAAAIGLVGFVVNGLFKNLK
jgi:hypothetical protein